MVAEVHYAFPLAIYTEKLDNHEEFNRVILDNIKPYDFISTETTLTGEWLGKINIHHNPLFEDFFKTVLRSIKDYVSFLGIEEEFFRYYFTKTWLSVIDRPELHFEYHIHPESDISWVYYVEVPKNAAAVAFGNLHLQNQLFEGMMSDGRLQKDATDNINGRDLAAPLSFFKERNTANFTSFHIPPSPGLLVLFPGKQRHATIAPPYATGPQEGKRIAVVGDVSMFLKPEHLAFESGRIYVDHMRTFD